MPRKKDLWIGEVPRPVGEYMREVMAEQGISQNHLSRMTGITVHTLSGVANNPLRIISGRVALKIELALGLPPSTLAVMSARMKSYTLLDEFDLLKDQEICAEENIDDEVQPLSFDN